MSTQNNSADPWLSQYFGTFEKTAADEQASGDDQELMAAVLLLEKTAAEKGIDLSQFSADDIVNTASELFMNKEAAAEPQMSDADREWFELQKFAGAVQAHAFVAELRNIDEMSKEAEGRARAAYDAVAGAARRAGGATRKAENTVSERVGAPFISKKKRDAITGEINKQQLLHSLPDGVISNKEYAKAQADAAAAGGEALKNEAIKRGRIAGGVGLGALGVGGTAAAVGGKKSESADRSAIEQLIAVRQYEMLKEAGYVDEYGNVLAPEQTQEKTASDFLSQIDEIALQGLFEAGYPRR